MAPTQLEAAKLYLKNLEKGLAYGKTTHGVRRPSPSRPGSLTTPGDSGRIAARCEGLHPRCAKAGSAAGRD